MHRAPQNQTSEMPPHTPAERGRKQRRTGQRGGKGRRGSLQVCTQFYKMLNSLPIFSTQIAAYKSSNMASHEDSKSLETRRADCSIHFGQGLQSPAANDSFSHHLNLRWLDSSPGQAGHTSYHS